MQARRSRSEYAPRRRRQVWASRAGSMDSSLERYTVSDIAREIPASVPHADISMCAASSPYSCRSRIQVRRGWNDPGAPCRVWALHLGSVREHNPASTIVLVQANGMKMRVPAAPINVVMEV